MNLRAEREGSPWKGLWAVMTKEMADHLTSVRMQILEALIALTAFVTVYAAIQKIRTVIGHDPFLFLKLFTENREPLPAFVGLLGFLVPLVAIALAFDAINGEFNRRTISRLLAQPIYRDALLFGKFLAGFFTLALMLVAIWLLVMGLGLLLLGVPPRGEEVLRSFLHLGACLFYGGIWLAVALLFSVIFRQPATAALASIAVWLFFSAFWVTIAEALAPLLRPVHFGLPEEYLAQVQATMALSRLSPNILYGEITLALLRPEIRALGPLLAFQLQGAILGSPLPLSQSLLLIWPHLTGLVASTILLFALSYVLFQRQEIRA
ncbi:MAG: ABC transporter permease [Anaerolineae bacterium]|nr:ABC transporter permease [Anaerolineae bacterium]MDW8101814.1 ABC transporter permease [Anaerolineae bacterium]